MGLIIIFISSHFKSVVASTCIGIQQTFRLHLEILNWPLTSLAPLTKQKFFHFLFTLIYSTSSNPDPVYASPMPQALNLKNRVNLSLTYNRNRHYMYGLHGPRMVTFLKFDHSNPYYVWTSSDEDNFRVTYRLQWQEIMNAGRINCPRFVRWRCQIRVTTLPTKRRQ